MPPLLDFRGRKKVVESRTALENGGLVEWFGRLVAAHLIINHLYNAWCLCMKYAQVKVESAASTVRQERHASTTHTILTFALLATACTLPGCPPVHARRNARQHSNPPRRPVLACHVRTR